MAGIFLQISTPGVPVRALVVLRGPGADPMGEGPPVTLAFQTAVTALASAETPPLTFTRLHRLRYPGKLI